MSSEQLQGNTKVYNWAETTSCLPSEVLYPKTIDDIVKIVRRAAARGLTVRVFGARHSPSDIFCSNDILMSLDNFQRIIKVEGTLVTCEAGIRLHQLNTQLPGFQLALKNLGSIADQSMAGAISTGTHGTGIGFGIIATTVEWMEIVTGTGEIMTCSVVENTDIFQAARCGLGCLGVITKVAIRCTPAFKLHARQYGAGLDDTLAQLDTLIPSAQHVRFHYYPHTDKVVIWKASRTEQAVQVPAGSWWSDRVIGIHAIEAAYYAATWTPSLIPRINEYYWQRNSQPMETVDQSDKVFNMECLFKQFVDEWAIPVQHTAAALRDIRSYIEETGLKVHFPIEVRFVDEDDIWMSPAYGRKTCYIGIIQYRPYGKTLNRHQYWRGYEAIMHKYQGRPHWAKTHPFNKHDLLHAYPRFQDFLQVRERLDPKGVFVNDYIQRTLLQGDQSGVQPLPTPRAKL